MYGLVHKLEKGHLLLISLDCKTLVAVLNEFLRQSIDFPYEESLTFNLNTSPLELWVSELMLYRCAAF